MSSISLNHVINGALVNATQVKLRDPTGTFGIKNSSTGTVVVAPTAAITPDPAGVYSYDTSLLTVGVSYTAIWEVYYPSLVATPKYVSHIFQLDASVAYVDGHTLAEIEWALARRIGPHERFVMKNGAANTASQIYVEDIKSNIGSGGQYTDLHVLRRGISDNPQDQSVAGYVVGDRIRRVSEVNLTTGFLTVDRIYATPPPTNEILELMYIHPSKIREAVKDGLQRAKMPDTVSITISGAAAERDLTASIPWLKRSTQLQDIMYGAINQYHTNRHFAWNEIIGKQGHLWIRPMPDPYPNPIEVQALRPVGSYVNGNTNMSGPDDDTDILIVPLDYAVAAGHIELWRTNKADLQAAAQIGYNISQEEAALEFTKKSMQYTKKTPQKIEAPRMRAISHGLQTA